MPKSRSAGLSFLPSGGCCRGRPCQGRFATGHAENFAPLPPGDGLTKVKKAV